MSAAKNLPKEYKVGVFEAKGEPIKFKQVKLELPKSGEVSLTAPSSPPPGTCPQLTLHPRF